MLMFFLPERVQNHCAADAEANDGGQRGNHHQTCTEMEAVGEDRRDGKKQSQNIQPKRSANRTIRVFTEAQFEKQGSESDGRHHDESEWTGECRAARIEDHQRECQQQQSGSHESPAARLGFRRRIGCGFGQGIVIQR